ncbi:MAG: hypothetical protein GIKADHBN_00312 [Phycisphaerales bacterium]|nr:hypothetical protein [Phycisphaerales bacterium]MCK6475535.1 hypothetical protein [Phycisphaerales bacterium]
MKTCGRFHALAGILVAAACASGAMAQQVPTQSVTRIGTSVSAPAGTETTVVVTSTRPERDTLMKFMRPLTVEFKESRLEDVVNFMAEVTGADLEPMWIDDRDSTGLNKDLLITFNAKNLNALKVMEKILQKSSERGDFGENTWQMSESGAMQIGPKERLNAFKRLETYDINDLLLVLPRYDNAPEFDLQSVLQSSGQGGGGSSQSPFRDTQQDREAQNSPTREERATSVVDIVTQLVEPEQWTDNGGTGGTIRYYQGTLMVNAPDYMHRQINGYPYWSAGQSVSVVKGRRWVSLNLDTAASQLEGLANQPVTAVVPGGGR